MYYVGLDVHKKTISYCVKAGGSHQEGKVGATRRELDAGSRLFHNHGRFTGWIYDHLLAHANSRGALRIVLGLAANTDSTFGDVLQGPETANECPLLRRQEPPPRGIPASCGYWRVRWCALLRSARQENCVFPLTKTYTDVG